MELLRKETQRYFKGRFPMYYVKQSSLCFPKKHSVSAGFVADRMHEAPSLAFGQGQDDPK